MPRRIDHPNHPSSRSCFSPGALPRIPTICRCVTINSIPFRRSSSHIPPGTFVIVRSLPERVTARRFAAAPLLAAVNQTSSPARDQRTPSTEDHPEESFFSFPLPSELITATDPWPSSPEFLWSEHATHLPSGEILAWLIQLTPSNRTLPMGYSRRQ